jgi:hypothetical protein
MLISSIETSVLVDSDFANVNPQWSVQVQQPTSSGGFLAILNGRAAVLPVQQHYICTRVLMIPACKVLNYEFLGSSSWAQEEQVQVLPPMPDPLFRYYWVAFRPTGYRHGHLDGYDGNFLQRSNFFDGNQLHVFTAFATF